MCKAVNLRKVQETGILSSANTFPAMPLNTMTIASGCLVCSSQGIKGFTSERFCFIEQWSEYYEDDGEETTLEHDTYKYYNDQDYGYVHVCF